MWNQGARNSASKSYLASGVSVLTSKPHWRISRQNLMVTKIILCFWHLSVYFSSFRCKFQQRPKLSFSNLESNIWRLWCLEVLRNFFWHLISLSEEPQKEGSWEWIISKRKKKIQSRSIRVFVPWNIKHKSFRFQCFESFYEKLLSFL